MPQDDRPLVEIGDLGTAVRLMTTLPAPEGDAERGRGLLSVWAWPLAGLAIALIAAVVGLLLRKLDMGAGLAAAGVLMTLTALTGARHEAALARAMGALFGAKPEPGTEMIGGQMAVLLVTLARWSALAALLAAGHGLGPILGAAVLSRAALPVLMVALPAATSGAKAHAAPTLAPPRASAAIALVIGLTLALFCLGWTLIPAVAAAGVVAVAIGLVAQYRIGGGSADVVQAAQPVIDLAVLAALLAAL